MCTCNIAGLYCKCKNEGNCTSPFNAQQETSESDESCFESFAEMYTLYLSKLQLLKIKLTITKAIFDDNYDP